MVVGLKHDVDKSCEYHVNLFLYYFLEEPVTLNSVVVKLKEQKILDIGRTTLYRLLKKMGFNYIRDNNRRSLMEKPNIRILRFRFLQKYMENEAKGPNKKPYIFLDETWIFQNGTARRSWQDNNPKSVRKVTGDGSRYIL